MTALDIVRDVWGEIRGVRCEHGRRVKRCSTCRGKFHAHPDDAALPETPGHPIITMPLRDNETSPEAIAGYIGRTVRIGNVDTTGGYLVADAWILGRRLMLALEPRYETCTGCARQYLRGRVGHLCREHLLCTACHPPLLD